MYLFGHLGCGAFLSTPIIRRLSLTHRITKEERSYYFGWLLVGCLLPDLIDKPLHIITTQLEISLPLVSGDKSFGHTVLFALALILFSTWRGNLIGKLLGFGAVTHLILDLLGDSSYWWWFGKQAYPIPPYHFESPKLAAYFWPFWTSNFPPSSQKNVLDYWSTLLSPPLLLWEVFGLVLFNWTRSRNNFAPWQYLCQRVKYFKR